MSEQSIADKFRVERARRDFSYFSDQFRYPPPEFKPVQMHRDWENILQSAYGKYHRILILAGRGSAKSERVTINYPSWMIGNNPNLRITIVSTPEDKAVSFLNKITSRVEEDAFYRACFGNLKPTNPKVWRTNAIEVKRTFYSKDPSICAVGSMGQAVSKRSDLIVLDDPLDSENTKTDYLRKDMIKWFYDALDPILEPHGLLIAIMTPWHEDDLSQYIMKQQGWLVLKYPAIPEPEKNMDEWLRTDDPNLTAWPEKYGYKTEDIKYDGSPILGEDGKPKMISFLRSKYNANIDAFMSQYILSPFSVTGSMFNEEWIEYFTPDQWRMVLANCVGYQGWDLAISLEERADYTACATLAHDVTTNKIYILQIFRDKLTPIDQFTAVQRIYQSWNTVLPIKQITIESDQYQAALAMGLTAATTLPIVESKSRGKRKLDRIGLLGPHFQNKRFAVAEFMRGGEFIYEYKRFPRGAHEDMLDSLCKAAEPILGQTAEGAFVVDEVDFIRRRSSGVNLNELLGRI